MSTAHTTTRARLAALAALAGLTVAGCQPGTTPPTTTASITAPPHDLLGALTVAPEDTTARYDRDEWGDWTSHGHGCTTREQVLAEQGNGTVTGDDCRPVCPATGPACWTSPYDRAQLRDPRQVHIDHRVPLAEAQRSGAAGWTTAQRERFYNDRSNLVAASAASNTAKGDQDPARWQPSETAARCAYATAYAATKHTYRLSVDPAEHDALLSLLGACGNAQ